LGFGQHILFNKDALFLLCYFGDIEEQ